MKLYNILIIFFLILFISCEEVIDIDLNSASPKVVIEADLNDLGGQQIIYISNTVNFDEASKGTPIENAIVTVSDDKGRVFNFTQLNTAGAYVNQSFKPNAGNIYKLKVEVADEVFHATSVMPKYVPIDSLGIIEKEAFGDTSYFITMKFTDPINEENFYKYSLSLDETDEFKFSNAFNDKFNDGLFVTHELGIRDYDIQPGDSVTIIRSIIDKNVYKYWNDIKSINPGSAAPANPKSNIDNGALGYFSVSSSKKFGYRVWMKKN